MSATPLFTPPVSFSRRSTVDSAAKQSLGAWISFVWIFGVWIFGV